MPVDVVSEGNLVINIENDADVNVTCPSEVPEVIGDIPSDPVYGFVVSVGMLLMVCVIILGIILSYKK